MQFIKNTKDFDSYTKFLNSYILIILFKFCLQFYNLALINVKKYILKKIIWRGSSVG